MKVHQIKIDFNVTEQIKRFVYVVLLLKSTGISCMNGWIM